MKKDPFKKHVKMKVKEAAFKALMDTKESHSKMENLSYKKLDMKCSSSFSQKASSLFRFRTNMADVKMNFKNKYSSFSLLCPMGCEKEDSQLHLLECEDLNDISEHDEINYMDILSENSTKSLEVAEILMQKEKFRKRILEI